MVAYDFRPMEPLPWSEPFSEPGWIFQVKWDGVRMLALWEQATVRLVNRRGASRTDQYPEIAELGKTFPSGTLIDGELVVLLDGKPQFDLILRRDQRRQAAAIKQAVERWPVMYAVFDLLYWQGEDIRTWPLAQRQATLSQIWPSNCAPLHLVENFSQGKELFKVVGSAGLEGIVAKRLQSYYTPGKGKTDWRKIKHWRQLTCAVGGYTLRAGLPSALLLGLYNDGELIYAGRAGSGLSSSDWQAIIGFLQAAEIEKSPFATTPLTTGREVRWVEPHLAVQVKFMEWSSDLKLRAPVILGFSPATYENCNFTQGV